MYTVILCINILVLFQFSAACFSSVHCVRAAVYAESKLITHWDDFWFELDEITAENEPALQEFQNFIQKTRTEISTALTNEKFVENPVNLYHMAKRQSMAWIKRLEELQELWVSIDVENENDTKTDDYDGDECWRAEAATVPVYHQDKMRRKSIKSLGVFLRKCGEALNAGRFWLKDTDFEGAQNAIFQAERVYKLSIDDLLQGRFVDGVEVEPLKAIDVFFISNYVAGSNVANVWDAERWAQKWVELKQQKKPHDNQTAVVLAKWLNAIGDPYKAYEIIQSIKDTYPHRAKIEELEMKYKNKFHAGKCKSYPRPPTEFKNVQSYGELCSMTSYTVNMNPEISKTLICQYEPTEIPYIQALVEYASYDPVIKIYHKVLTDKEIIRLQALGKPHMDTAKIGTKGQEHASLKRHTDISWLSRHRSPLVNGIYNRVQSITGLSTMVRLPKYGRSVMHHAEHLQLANYGPGGFYEPHYDAPTAYNKELRSFTPGKSPEFSERIATWMFYLSDVTYGGRTVFTMLNVTVPVTKGSAVFWWNLHRNGEADKRMLHAGCPVLLGSKWVSNLWILENGQVFRRSCSTDKDM